MIEETLRIVTAIVAFGIAFLLISWVFLSENTGKCLQYKTEIVLVPVTTYVGNTPVTNIQPMPVYVCTKYEESEKPNE